MERAAHDWAPLAGAGVDTDGGAHGLGLLDELVEEGLVGGGAGGPVLGALDVEPELGVLDAVILEVADGAGHLGAGGGAALGAGEHVHVHGRDPGVVRVGHRGGAVGVGVAGRLECTDHGKLVALVLEAGPGRSGDQLGDISSMVSGTTTARRCRAT